MIGKFERRETKEVLGLMGKLTILRHGETTYTDKFPDLTETGVDQAIMAGKNIKIDENEELLFLSSPKARAKGTLHYVAKQFGIDFEEGGIKADKKIRFADISDLNKAMDYFTGLYGTEDRSQWHIKQADQAFARGEFPENIFGKKSDIEKRIADAVFWLVRFFDKCSPDNKNKVFHMVAVTHFEVMQTFASLLFSDLLADDTYNLAEKMDVEFENLGNKKVKLNCIFRGVNRSVMFDRSTRKFTAEK